MKPDVLLRFWFTGFVYVLVYMSIQCEGSQHKHKKKINFRKLHGKHTSEHHHSKGDVPWLNVRKEKTPYHKEKKFEPMTGHHKSKFQNPIKRTNSFHNNLLAKLTEDGDEIAEINNLIDRDDDVDKVALSDTANNFTHNSDGATNRTIEESKTNSSDYMSSDIPIERYLSSKRSGNKTVTKAMSNETTAGPKTPGPKNTSSTRNSSKSGSFREIEKQLNELVSLDTNSPDEKHFERDHDTSKKHHQKPSNQSPDLSMEGVKLPSSIEMMTRFVAWLRKYKVTHPDSPVLQDKHLNRRFKDWLEKVFSGNYVSTENFGVERVFDDFLREDLLHDQQPAESSDQSTHVKDQILVTQPSDGNIVTQPSDGNIVTLPSDGNIGDINAANSPPSDIMTYNVPYYIHSPSNVIYYQAHQQPNYGFGIHHHTDHVYKHHHYHSNKTFHHYVETVHPCQNGGIKIPGDYAGFQCICKKKFIGKFCGEINYCSSCPCQNNGTCNVVSHLPWYHCTCSKSYYGKHCEKQNPCEPNGCQNGGTCSHDGKGNTACICKKGFRGEFCQELDGCFPSPCRNGGSCSQLTKNNETFTCNCPINFKGPVCQYPTFCPSNPCDNGGTCRETNDDFQCICKEGYIGKRCTDRPCSPNPCYYGSTCAENGTDYRCLCSPWASGRNCSEISPCRLKPCRSDGQCVDALSGFRWAFRTMQYYCLCRPPYMGPHCTDIICNHCSPNGHCNNQSTCVCDDGYSGNGFVCEPENPDPCKPNPCSNDGTCIKDKNGDYVCECKHPYLPPHCDIGDPCIPDPCVNGKCVSHSDQTFQCKCIEGYRGSHCNISVPCVPNPCQHNGACSVNETTGKTSCQCKGEWLQPVCAECNCPKSPDLLTRPGTHCDPDTGACVCNSFNDKKWYFSQRNRTCNEEDPGQVSTTAMPNPCQNGGTYQRKTDASDAKCVCSEWFYGDKCQYLKQCKPHNPCLNGGTCVEDLKGNFTCKCPPGTTGFKCDALPTTTPEPPHPCNPNPCLNGGTCTTLQSGYDCKCMPRFTGSNCLIDRCHDCDVNAKCEQGHCKCKSGYTGNGYECVLESKPKCGQCPTYSTCVPLTGYCGCQNGYTFSDKICIPLDALEDSDEDNLQTTARPHTQITVRPHTNPPKHTTRKPIPPSFKTPSTPNPRTTTTSTTNGGAMPEPTTPTVTIHRTPTTSQGSTKPPATSRPSSTALRSPTTMSASSLGPPGSMPDDDNEGPPPPDLSSFINMKKHTQMIAEDDNKKTGTDSLDIKPEELKSTKSYHVL